MNIQLEVYSALCETAIFTINDIKADYYDFGNKYDADRENAPDYCCGNMVFEGKEPIEEVLNKYDITEEEYSEIVFKLHESLSFGSCGWCS